MKFSPIELALESLGCSQSELARRIGVNHATVSIWKRRGHIPLAQVKKVAEVSGVPAHVLCPKYFPRPVTVAPAAE